MLFVNGLMSFQEGGCEVNFDGIMDGVSFFPSFWGVPRVGVWERSGCCARKSM